MTKMWHGCCCSVAKSCPTLCDPMDRSTPGFPVLHYLPEYAHTHARWVSDPIQPSHPLTSFSFCPQSFPASGSFPMSQFLSNESALCIRWPQYWSFSISPSNEYSGLTSFRIDWFDLLTVWSTLKGFLQHYNLKAPFFGAQPSLWSNSHVCAWLLGKT